VIHGDIKPQNVLVLISVIQRFLQKQVMRERFFAEVKAMECP
jgi:hypothetical protein